MAADLSTILSALAYRRLAGSGTTPLSSFLLYRDLILLQRKEGHIEAHINILKALDAMIVTFHSLILDDKPKRELYQKV